MAVLFANSFGHTLNPANRAELLQGFLNIQNAEGVTDGKLTKANMVDYAQKTFVAADPNSAVASYFNNNFDAISKIDDHDNTITIGDLVRLRPTLPHPSPTTNTPTTGTSATTGSNNTNFGTFPIFNPIAYQPYTGTQGNYGQQSNHTGINNQSASQLMLLIISQMVQLLKSIL